MGRTSERDMKNIKLRCSREICREDDSLEELAVVKKMLVKLILKKRCTSAGPTQLQVRTPLATVMDLQLLKGQRISWPDKWLSASRLGPITYILRVQVEGAVQVSVTRMLYGRISIELSTAQTDDFRNLEINPERVPWDRQRRPRFTSLSSSTWRIVLSISMLYNYCSLIAGVIK